MMDKRIIYEKVKFYSEKDISIHVQTSSGTFYNGNIKSIDENSIVIEDLKLGEVYISFSEVINLQPYKTKDVRV